MDKPLRMDGLTLREATEEDIPQLAVHHRKMFEEIWEKKGRQFGSPVAVEMERGYIRKLREELPTGSCKSWVVEQGGRVVASGAISFLSFVPTPADLSSKVAYLHSMYTEAGLRGKGLASCILKGGLAHCKTQGIKRVLLSASEAGRPVYERAGFAPYPEMMRIFVD